jgi:hypothetical protein
VTRNPKEAMNTSIRSWICPAVCLTLAALPGCAAAQEQVVKAQPATVAVQRPSVIYVTDFHLDPSQIKHTGLLGGPPLLPRGKGTPREAAALVRVLSDSIVRDLKKAGLRAERLRDVRANYCPVQTKGRIQFAAGNASLPKEGWLVAGWFEELRESDSAVTATAGLGAGSGKALADVAVSDLGRDPSAPFMVIGSGSRVRRMPGGLLTMNPYVMAGKFVFDKATSTEKDMRSLGADVAKSLVNYIKQGSTGNKNPNP